MDVAAAQAVPRRMFFGCVLPLLAANGAVTLARPDILREGGLSSAVNLWGISAILWLAVAAGCALLLSDEHHPADFVTQAAPTPLSRIDTVLLVVSASAMMLPVPALSTGALTLLSGWLIVSSPPRSRSRRAGVIFLAVTNSLMWGRLLLSFESGPMLSAEGWLIKATSGATGVGNLVHFKGSDQVFVIAPGCSSLQGVSLAIVLWMTAIQYFDIAVHRRALFTLVAMIAGAISSNVMRLDAIASWPAHFDFLHYGLGSALFGWLGLALISGALWVGMRHALVRR